MAKNPLARHGGLTYLHIPAADLRHSGAFYREVLGWKIEERSDGLPGGNLIGLWQFAE